MTTASGSAAILDLSWILVQIANVFCCCFYFRRLIIKDRSSLQSNYWLRCALVYCSVCCILSTNNGNHEANAPISRFHGPCGHISSFHSSRSSRTYAAWCCNLRRKIHQGTTSRRFLDKCACHFFIQSLF